MPSLDRFSAIPRSPSLRRRGLRSSAATVLALLGGLTATACSKTPTATAGEQEAPAPTASAAGGPQVTAEPAEGSAAPMGLTGVLSEAEFAALHELSDAKRPAPRGEMLPLAGGQAYLSLPEGEGPFPAVIVIHEWWGLNAHIKYWSDRLAADGYAALAVDLYDAKTASKPEEAMALMKSVEASRAKTILAAAAEFLKSDARIRASRRGVIGWCFGGGWSLQTAIDVDGLDAAVLYYGRLVEDEAALAQIEAPVLAVFGNQDKGIPPEAVDRWETAMKAAGRDLRILRYDAEHAFANPSGAHYDAEAAEDAWKQARAFLASRLKSPAEGVGETAAERCNTAADCGPDMVCEGQGCGEMEGVCAPKVRKCTRDLVPFCGCDGKTFRNSSRCPGDRFAHTGACAE